MEHPRFRGAEIAERGEEIYARRLRAEVETAENIGKIISIDIETGEYSIDADLLVAGKRMLAKRPDAPLYGKRIGYNAVYGIGGSTRRVTP